MPGLGPLAPQLGGSSPIGPNLKPLAPSFDLSSPGRGAPSPQPTPGLSPNLSPHGAPAGPYPPSPAHSPGPATPHLAAATPPGAPLNAPAGRDHVSPALSVEQYACLEAELAAQPAREALTLQRYELDAAGIEALRSRYQTLFAGDPALQERFTRLVEYYRNSFTRR